MNLNKKEKENICSLYKNGYTQDEISFKYKIYKKIIRNILIENQITIRQTGYKKYSEDYDFFKKIDAFKKAYWLGFICADGCVGDGLKIELHRKDIELLIQFKKDIKSNSPIRVNLSRPQYVIFKIFNKIILQDIEKYGIVPNKTHSLWFPLKNNHKFINAFMLGYFDGDGHICITKRDRKTPSVDFGISSNIKFLIEYQKILIQKCKLNKIKINNKKNPEFGQFIYSGRNNIKKIYNFLYKDANFFLKRKQKIFLKSLNG